MRGIVAAIFAGFWPRLMGYISAAKNRFAGRVQELASQPPTSVSMSIGEAAELLDLGERARQAAHSWAADIPFASLNIPTTPFPSSPNIEGGQAPGRYEVGLVVTNRPGMDEYPVTFSTDNPCRPPGNLQACLESLQDYLTEIGSSTPGLTAAVQQAVGFLIHGPKQGYRAIPLWIIERLD